MPSSHRTSSHKRPRSESHVSPTEPAMSAQSGVGSFNHVSQQSVPTTEMSAQSSRRRRAERREGREDRALSKFVAKTGWVTEGAQAPASWYVDYWSGSEDSAQGDDARLERRRQKKDKQRRKEQRAVIADLKRKVAGCELLQRKLEAAKRALDTMR